MLSNRKVTKNGKQLIQTRIIEHDAKPVYSRVHECVMNEL